MAYVLSNGHVTDDVTWPQNVLWGSTVGYPSDSLASCRYSPWMKSTVILKPRLWVTQGHWKWHCSIDRIWVRIHAVL